MQIGMQTKQAIIKTLDELAENYLGEIDEAYSLTEADLDITFKVKLKPDSEGGVLIQSDLSFTKGYKVKDTIVSKADENQRTLFGEGMGVEANHD